MRESSQLDAAILAQGERGVDYSWGQKRPSSPFGILGMPAQCCFYVRVPAL